LRSSQRSPRLDVRGLTSKGREGRKDGREGQGRGMTAPTYKARGEGRRKGERDEEFCAVVVFP